MHNAENVTNKRIGHEKPQPSPEAKKAGWAKRKNFLYWKQFYEKKSFPELKKLMETMKESKKYNVIQFRALAYVMKEISDFRYIKDDRDREEGKAKEKVELTGLDGQPIQVENKIKVTDDKVKRALKILKEVGAFSEDSQ